MKKSFGEPSDWQILISCIMGFRAGCWDIPHLREGTVEEKIVWINTHNTSNKPFTISDWKNTRRPERQAHILPKYKILKKLHELQRDLPSDSKTQILKDGVPYEINKKNVDDGLKLLHSVNDSVIALSFFDPEYREVLDHLSYGNEGERQHERAELPQMDTALIHSFILELSRVTKPSGYMMVWIDKYLLCNGIDNWLQGSDFQKVDMLVWKKTTIGMGSRLRSTAEYLMICQKKPLAAKATWADRSIPDVWTEKAPQTHPHAKPLHLEERLILATTKVGDAVCDPCAGSYGVLQVCQKTSRQFIGSDLVEDCYHKKIRHRLDPLFSSKSDEWATPQDFYDSLNKEFNFTLDPCATFKNHKANKFFTIDDDGLTKDWSGETAFVNPPYSCIAEWVKKCWEESLKPNTTIVLLIPSRTDTAYFQDYIDHGHASEIRFLRGRLKFGNSENSAPFPSMLAIYSQKKEPD